MSSWAQDAPLKYLSGVLLQNWAIFEEEKNCNFVEPAYAMLDCGFMPTVGIAKKMMGGILVVVHV